MDKPVRIEILMVDKLSAGLDRGQRKMKELGQGVSAVNQELGKTDNISSRLQNSVGKLVSAFAIKELVTNIAKVRGQFQQLEVAFTTMLQSAEKADALMQQLTRTAATTPFGLEDVAQGAKQLLAYGFEAEKVNETLIRLGDIAAGLSVPLNDLVYLYGTTMAQGRMYTQDLNQFTNRGIPMISELAKQFGVAESKVRDLVEAGKVGFPEVQKVVESLTSEGGKFGGLMEEQSRTIVGQISNIEDSVSMMFNELGQQSEGIINATLSGVSYVIENYERFGRILLGLVGTYGTYRTAVMLVTAAKGWATTAEVLHFNWLLLVEKAQKKLNATMLANPYVLMASLIAGVVAAMISMKSETELIREADERYEQQKQKVLDAEEEHKRRLDELSRIAGDEALSTDTRREALIELEKKYPDIFAKYDTELEKLRNIKNINEEIVRLERQRSFARPENELKGVEERIAELEKKKDSGPTRTVYNRNLGESYDIKLSGLSREEEAELKNLKAKRKQLSGTIRKNQVSSYFENLTGVSNETLEIEIKRRKDLLAKMEVQEKTHGMILSGDPNLHGTFSRDELQFQLNRLTAEQNARTAERNTGSGWRTKARKDYEAALKAYNDFVNDTTQKLTQAEFEKKAKELKDNLDAAKKEYDRSKPSSDSDAEKVDKRLQKEQAEAERRQQLQQKLGQELADLQRQNDAAEIAAMKEGIEKKLREIDNEYQARKNAIDKQEADWQRDNKKAGIATGENGLTADQTAAIEKARRQAAALTQEATNEALREEEKANREAINGYLRQYGDYAQKRQAITEQANDRICELEEELARATTAEAQAAAQARIDTVKAETREQLEELDVQYGKAKQFMIDLFEDASQKSVGEIDKIIRKYEELVKFLKGDGSTSREQLKDLGFSDAEIDKALEKLSKEGVQSIKAVTDTLKGLKGELQSRSPWQSFAANLNKGIEMLKKADGDIMKIGKGVSGIGEAVSDFTPQLQQFSADLANIFGFDDAKVQDAIAAVGGLGQTAAGVGQMMSGDVVGGAMAAVNGISTMVDALDGLFGADYSQYNRLVEQYEGLIGVWDTLIDRKREYVGVSYGAEAIKAGKEALELIEKEGEAYRTLGKERLNSGASAGSHSIGVRIKKNTSGDDWRRIAQSLGMSVSAAQDTLGGRLGGLFDLSSEQIKKLQEENQVWWAKLDGDVRKYLEGIIDSEEKWAAMQEQMRERLTTTTRENVFDDFLGHLYDLADGSSEVMDGIADNWQQMVNRMAVNNLVGAKFRQSLEGWYEELAELNEARAGGSMTDAEYRSRIDALKAEYDGYVEAARRDIETLRAEGIVKATGDAAATTQSGKAGGFSTMTQDQGTKLEGLFVSGQMHWASIDEKMTDVAEQLGRAGDTLRRIEENTGANAKTAAVILDKMKELIRDGIKVK